VTEKTPRAGDEQQPASVSGEQNLDDYSLPRWHDRRWRTLADAWVAQSLRDAGIRATAPGEQQRARPWSTLIRYQSDAGPLWFKANAIGMAHEAGLYAVLQRHCPGHVLEPVALDVERGWLLLPDGGLTLRDVEGVRTDLAMWERMLLEYAEMQRILEPHVDELFAVGMVDAAPEALTAMRDALLAPGVATMGEPAGLTPVERDELVAHAPAYAAQCRDLAAFGIPPTLQHDDLHDHNAFVPETPGGPLRVFDWGDAVVGHPFGTLLISLRFVADLARLDYGSRELLRLRDAYLEPWTGDFDRADLLEAARLAVRVGGVTRADCYRRAMLEADPSLPDPFGEGVPTWLKEQRGPTPLEPAGLPPEDR
jgi:hypothetical protein